MGKKINNKRLTEIVDSIGYDFSDFLFDSFVKRIEKTFKRKLFFFNGPMPQGVQGMWISDAERPAEYIFHEENLPAVHLQHVQLHELGHFLCGHKTLKISQQDIQKLLQAGKKNAFEELSFNLVRCRHDEQATDTLVEQEAETIANIILARALKYKQKTAISSPHSTSNDLFSSLGLD